MFLNDCELYRNRYIIISLHIMYIAQNRHKSDDTQSFTQDLTD